MGILNFTDPRYLYLEPLKEDVAGNLATMEAEITPLSRKNYVRSLFALIEGLVSNLREYALFILLDDLRNNFEEQSLYEIMALSDQDVYLKGNGQVRFAESRRPSLSLLACSIRVITKSEGEWVEDDWGFVNPPEVIYFKDSGWESMQKAVKVRNRITHPKFSIGWDITDDEIMTIHRARKWIEWVTKDLSSLDDVD